MKCKLVTVSAAIAALAVGVTAASATTTVIGGAGQSTSQGVNGSQSGLNGDVGGSTFITGKSAPTETQTSLNTVNHTQAIGAGSTTTLIGTGASPCFCQSNTGAINNSQVAVNGDGGGAITAILADSTPALTQSATNGLRGSQSIGSLLVAADSVVIAPVGQANTQGINDRQSGRNGTAGSGPVFVTGAGGSAPALTQNVCNDLSNITVLGGQSLGPAPGCSAQR